MRCDSHSIKEETLSDLTDGDCESELSESFDLFGFAYGICVLGYMCGFLLRSQRILGILIKDLLVILFCVKAHRDCRTKFDW